MSDSNGSTGPGSLGRGSRRDERVLNIRHNPVLALRSANRFALLPPECKKLLRELLDDLSKEARRNAEHCWHKGKGPMAMYWRAVSVYARHIGRAVNRLPESHQSCEDIPQQLEAQIGSTRSRLR